MGEPEYIETKSFPIVGIGSSAGGLKAITNFLKGIEEGKGIAYVLIPHLGRGSQSMLPSILKKRTVLEVLQVEDGMVVEKDKIYIIPSNWAMTVKDGHLKLTVLKNRPGLIHNIDFFFKSLAFEAVENGVAVILSGSGTDGTVGAKIVKAELGIVAVQEPREADFGSMPLTATLNKLPDIVEPANDIPKKIYEYFNNYKNILSLHKGILKKEPSIEIKEILNYMQYLTNIDLKLFNDTFITKRVLRRMALKNIDSFVKYFDFLKNNTEEILDLKTDFYIKLNHFFRGRESFEALKERVKQNFKDSSKKEFKVWVLGCATGEEAYTTGMVVQECFEEIGKPIKITVIGTDADRETLEIARPGRYPLAIENDIDKERIEKFFTKRNHYYFIKKGFRKNFLFDIYNPATDKPLAGIDILSGRDFMRDYKEEVQQNYLPIFKDCLN